MCRVDCGVLTLIVLIADFTLDVSGVCMDPSRCAGDVVSVCFSCKQDQNVSRCKFFTGETNEALTVHAGLDDFRQEGENCKGVISLRQFEVLPKALAIGLANPQNHQGAPITTLQQHELLKVRLRLTIFDGETVVPRSGPLLPLMADKNYTAKCKASDVHLKLECHGQPETQKHNEVSVVFAPKGSPDTWKCVCKSALGPLVLEKKADVNSITIVQIREILYKAIFGPLSVGIEIEPEDYCSGDVVVATVKCYVNENDVSHDPTFKLTLDDADNKTDINGGQERVNGRYKFKTTVDLDIEELETKKHKLICLATNMASNKTAEATQTLHCGSGYKTSSNNNCLSLGLCVALACVMSDRFIYTLRQLVNYLH